MSRLTLLLAILLLSSLFASSQDSSGNKSVSEPATHRFEYLHPAAGGGLRVKFNKHSGTNLALD